MKKFLMTLSLVLAVGIAMAQTSMKEVRSVTFYGVDFTKAKVVGAEYRAADMIRAFGNTNQAFMNEPNRFNVAKALKVAIERMQLTTVRERNLAIPYDALSTVEGAEALSEEQVAEVVAAYPEGSGYGALILGEEINGATSQVRLRMVVFDRTSREIVYQRVADIEVEGTTPRELWTEGIYIFLKKWKF
ncbi:MAG: hypothetical protein IKU92_00860 [Rikenellaceae bacterium]|nr:hypothetical protein [Rikenellaceae bacterium]